MAYTIAALTTQIQNRLDDSGFSSSMILQFLNDAQRDFLNDRLTKVMETSQSYSTVAQVSDLTNGSGLPVDFQAINDLRNTTLGVENVLFYMEAKEFDLQYPQPSLFGYNQPTIYYKYGSTISLFPTPDRVYTMVLRYYKKPIELVNATDVPEIPSEWQELLVLGALKRCHEFNDNYDIAAIVQGKIDEMLNNYARRMSIGKTQPSIMKLNGTSPARR